MDLDIENVVDRIDEHHVPFAKSILTGDRKVIIQKIIQKEIKRSNKENNIQNFANILNNICLFLNEATTIYNRELNNDINFQRNMIEIMSNKDELFNFNGKLVISYKRMIELRHERYDLFYLIIKYSYSDDWERSIKDKQDFEKFQNFRKSELHRIRFECIITKSINHIKSLLKHFNENQNLAKFELMIENNLKNCDRDRLVDLANDLPEKFSKKKHGYLHGLIQFAFNEVYAIPDNVRDCSDLVDLIEFGMAVYDLEIKKDQRNEYLQNSESYTNKKLYSKVMNKIYDKWANCDFARNLFKAQWDNYDHSIKRIPKIIIQIAYKNRTFLYHHAIGFKTKLKFIYHYLKHGMEYISNPYHYIALIKVLLDENSGNLYKRQCQWGDGKNFINSIINSWKIVLFYSSVDSIDKYIKTFIIENIEATDYIDKIVKVEIINV